MRFPSQLLLRDSKLPALEWDTKGCKAVRRVDEGKTAAWVDRPELDQCLAYSRKMLGHSHQVRGRRSEMGHPGLPTPRAALTASQCEAESGQCRVLPALVSLD